MNEYHIITDGSADLGTEAAAELGVTVVPFYVSFDGEHYQKEIEEVGIREFYQKMVDDAKIFPKSSMPSVQDYIDVFTRYAKEGTPVICICITVKFSGSYNSAQTAAEMVKKHYPDWTVRVIDSQVDTVLQNLYVREAVRMKMDGVEYEEAVEKLLAMRSTGRIFFTIGDMSYLVHGGRVGKLMGLAANTLRIRPLITLKEGEIFSSGMARGRKSSLAKVLKLQEKHFQERWESADEYQICVGYGYDYEEAKKFREQVLESVATYSHISDINIYQIGATIGVHTGPYPLGTSVIRKYEYV